MSESNHGNAGIGFSGLLLLLFIALKLTNVIEWSWLWVLSPVWIPFVLILVGTGLYVGIDYWLTWNRNKKRKTRTGL